MKARDKTQIHFSQLQFKIYDSWWYEKEERWIERREEKTVIALTHTYTYKPTYN